MTHHLFNLILRLVGLVCLFGWGGLIVQALFLNSPAIPLPLPGNWEPELPVWGYMVLSSILMAIAVSLFGSARLKSLAHQHKQTHRQLEKNSISSEWQVDHVRALEAKVETLEAALASAVRA